MVRTTASQCIYDVAVPKSPVLKVLEIPWKTRLWLRLKFLLIMRVISMVCYLGIGLLIWFGIRMTSRDSTKYSIRRVLTKWPLAYIKIFGVLKD